MMEVRDLLMKMAKRGITLWCGCAQDGLNARPNTAVTPELMAEVREHKAEIIQIVQGERLRETVAIRSERQVFNFARERFRRYGEGGAT
jgi:hypothetical protein